MKKSSQENVGPIIGYTGSVAQSGRRPVSESRQHELIYVIAPTIGEQEVTDLHNQIEEIVKTGGGQIEKTENWGRCRLAYEIDRHKDGTYVLELLNGPAELVKELDRRLGVIDDVLRHFIVRVDIDDVLRHLLIRVSLIDLLVNKNCNSNSGIQIQLTDQVPRLRVGVGSRNPRRDLADHVLAGFDASEVEVIREAVVRAANHFNQIDSTSE